MTADQSFPAELLIMVHKVVLTFKDVDEIRKSDLSKHSYKAVLSCRAVYIFNISVLAFKLGTSTIYFMLTSSQKALLYHPTLLVSLRAEVSFSTLSFA